MTARGETGPGAAADFRVPPDVLDTTDDADLAWRCIERAYEMVSIHDGPAVLDAGMARLTAGQRALLALHWIAGEVCNGGFDQFFMNPTGDIAAEALSGFRRIGATGGSELMVEVFRAFPGGPPPRDQEWRIAALDALNDDARDDLFEEFDDRFYTLMDSELYPRAAAYVRSHPEEFVRQ